MAWVGTAWRALQGMRRSALAFVASALLAVLGMGVLGAALYAGVSPVLGRFASPLDDWHGDWVWPALIGAGLAWSPAFLLAGWLHPRWRRPPRWWPPLAYAGVLWLWALLVWGAIVAVQRP